MAVVDKAGSVNNLSSVDTPNTKVAQNVTNGGKIRLIRETVAVAASDDDGSKYRMARIPSNIVISKITIANDAITGGTDYDLGFYDIPEVNSGAVIDADILVDGADLSSASRTVDGTSNVAIENLHKKAWEIAGLSEDPNKLIDIVLTGNTVGTAAGNIALSLEYSLD